MGVEFQKAHGPWTLSSAHGRAMSQSNFHYISDFQSYHLVYVDESGCDKRIGFRRTGWFPLGIAPIQVSKFHRDQRYQIQLDCDNARFCGDIFSVAKTHAGTLGTVGTAKN